MGIKVIKENKVRGYTFVDDALALEKPTEKESNGKKDRTEREFRRRDNAKIDKFKHKSKTMGSHNMQGHSPVYE